MAEIAVMKVGRTRKPNGSGYLKTNGYRGVTKNYKYLYEHILIAERALGRDLPIGAEVHHVDGVRHHNSNENLVICPDHAYHRLLHQRQDALTACGNAHWRKCNYCKKHDDPTRLVITEKAVYHKECSRAHTAASRAAKKSVQI